MRIRTSKIVASVAVIAAVAAGGAALTASNTIGDSVAGYGTSDITGATATNLHYTLAPGGASISQAVLTFNSDLTGKTVSAGFGGTGGVEASACAVSTVGTTGDTVTCDFTGQSTAAADSFHLAVAN